MTGGGRRSCRCRKEDAEFDFGFNYISNELSKNSRQFEKVPMYQFECWKDGQQLRFYESYVFEYLVFIVLEV